MRVEELRCTVPLETDQAVTVATVLVDETLALLGELGYTED